MKSLILLLLWGVVFVNSDILHEYKFPDEPTCPNPMEHTVIHKDDQEVCFSVKRLHQGCGHPCEPTDMVTKIHDYYCMDNFDGEAEIFIKLAKNGHFIPDFSNRERTFQMRTQAPVDCHLPKK